MQLATYQASTATQAEALFASVLQCSDRPSPGQVRKAIAAVVRAHGSRGCAELVAQEFGDHPETAAEHVLGSCGGRRRGDDMKRIRTGSPRIRRGRPWLEDLPADPRDPDVVRAKTLARARMAEETRHGTRDGHGNG